MRSLARIAVAAGLAAACAGCNVTAQRDVVAELTEQRAQQRAQRLAELEPKYGKCLHDGWRSVSQIGKTKIDELIRGIKACDVEWDMSSHRSANRIDQFVHTPARMWYFVNGVLVSYRH